MNAPRKINAVIVRFSRKREWLYLIDPELAASPASIAYRHARRMEMAGRHFAVHAMGFVDVSDFERVFAISAAGHVSEVEQRGKAAEPEPEPEF